MSHADRGTWFATSCCKHRKSSSYLLCPPVSPTKTAHQLQECPGSDDLWCRMLHRTCCCPPFQCFSKFQSIRYVDAARPGQLYNSWCFLGEDATATCRQVGWGGESLNPDESWCWNWSSLNTTRYVIWMTPEIHTRQASVSCERLVGGASCTSGSCWCGWLGWRLGPANHRVTQHGFFGRWNPEGIHRNPDGWVVSKIFW